MILLDREAITSVSMGGGLVGGYNVAFTKIGGGGVYQTPIVHYHGIMNVGGNRMLQFDWSILVTM